MSRRLVPVVLVVAALLAVAAVAAHGRPLGGSGPTPGPDAGYFDYVFTTVVILFVLVLVGSVVALVLARDELGPLPRRRNDVVALLFFCVTAFLLAVALSHSHFALPKRAATLHPHRRQTTTAPATTRGRAATRRGATLRWDEVVVVLAALAAVGAAVAVSRRRNRSRPLRLQRQHAVSLAVGESLDDLRAEADLRRAIVAAYARMERALAAAGVPRLPAEAPLEYLQRALLELETSADSVRRLTELFEWAKFSQHEPEPWMRDDALEALTAVRDELRAPAGAAA